MSGSACPHEKQVLEAAGRYSADLATHLAQCQSCSDLALVIAWLHDTEEPRELAVDLEQASRIWRVADAQKRREQAAKALLPLAVGQIAACLFGGLALLGFAGRYLASAIPASEAVGVRLLADPVVGALGSITAVLLIGVCFFSLAVAFGFKVARS
jgi:hypothetical protein